MTSNNYRRQPMSISTINIDNDDIQTLPREEYRQSYGYEDTISSDSEKRKARWCLIALILILVFITVLSIVAVIIAIYSLVLSKNKTETVIITLPTASTLTTITIPTSTGLTCSPSPTTSYEYSTATPSQCLNYTNNTDSTRNIGYTQSINNCDNVPPFNNSTATWIRFLDPAGKVVINSPESPNRCGTVATGWYAGQYPTGFYTTATSIVCFYYTTNTCASCSLISVTNCKTFYVFLLPEPESCNYRYCTL